MFIVTGDRDAFQLVDERCTVLYPKRGVSEMSRMARIFPAEKPEPRNSSSLVSSTCSGFGKRTPGNSALNRRRIDSAAFA